MPQWLINKTVMSNLGWLSSKLPLFVVQWNDYKLKQISIWTQITAQQPVHKPHRHYFHSKLTTVCKHVQVDPHISRPSFLAVIKTSKIQDHRIGLPLLYTVFQVMPLKLLTASHAMQQCEKSAYIATRLTADHSKVRRGTVRPRPTPPLWYASCDVSHVPATPIASASSRPTAVAVERQSRVMALHRAWHATEGERLRRPGKFTRLVD